MAAHTRSLVRVPLTTSNSAAVQTLLGVQARSAVRYAGPPTSSYSVSHAHSVSGWQSRSASLPGPAASYCTAGSQRGDTARHSRSDTAVGWALANSVELHVATCWHTRSDVAVGARTWKPPPGHDHDGPPSGPGRGMAPVTAQHLRSLEAVAGVHSHSLWSPRRQRVSAEHLPSAVAVAGTRRYSPAVHSVTGWQTVSWPTTYIPLAPFGAASNSRAVAPGHVAAE